MDEKEKVPAPQKSNIAHLDFITAIILLAVCVGAIVESIGYWEKAGGKFYASPGFTPILFSCILGYMSILLLLRSLKDGSVGKQLKTLGQAFSATIRSRQFYKTMGGIGIFAVYVYGFLGRLSFFTASLITLFAALMYTRFDKKPVTALWLLVIAVCSVSAIILLFEVAFHVPMP